jgi:hypothetical protein
MQKDRDIPRTTRKAFMFGVLRILSQWQMATYRNQESAAHTRKEFQTEALPHHGLS